MFVRLAYVFIFIISIISPLSVCAVEQDNEEKYLSIQILPTCNSEGQFKLVFANVSVGKIYVDKWIVDSQLFEPVSNGLSMFDPVNKVGVELWPSKIFKRTSDYVVLASGEFVEHIVNVNNHFDLEHLDRTLTYQVGYALDTDIVLEDGRKVSVMLNTWLFQTSLVIEPSCWQ